MKKAVFAATFTIAVFCVTSAFGQDNPGSKVQAGSESSSDLPRFGVGVSASTLGIGIQAATAVTRKSNVRVGFNGLDISHDLNNFNGDGIDYKATLTLRSVQASFDQYLAGGFHVSPGVLIYNGNEGSATASVPAGQAFTLGGTRFYSGQSDPVRGAGSVAGNKVAPMILVGFGNLLPRDERHFGWSVEAGFVFQGSPKATLHLNGTACVLSAQSGCLDAATDPTVQASVQAEQTKINSAMTPFQYYPVISFTLSYKFK